MDEKKLYELICDARKQCREMNCRDCDFQNRKDCKYEFMARHLAEGQKETITVRYELDLYQVEHIRAEVIKEIGERLKERLCNYDPDNYHSFRAVEEDVIDDVLKEMVGNTK